MFNGKKKSLREALFTSGAPCRNRIHNLLIRSQTLYPIELMAQCLIIIAESPLKFKSIWIICTFSLFL